VFAAFGGELVCDWRFYQGNRNGEPKSIVRLKAFSIRSREASGRAFVFVCKGWKAYPAVDAQEA